jgi:nitrite reductase (NADH) large subunit
MTRKSRLVVIGNGMAGARLVEDILARGGGDRHDIIVFGDERHGNYNRILLSSVLAGGHSPDDIFINALDWYVTNGVRLHAGVRVEAIDVTNKAVMGNDGSVESYDTLVLATGSRPFIPPIDGMMTDTGLKPGIFVFRTLDDCAGILQGATNARVAAIIGGGLLGLEAARGLLARGLDVHVVHLAPHLMNTQLDPTAAKVLRKQLEQMGVRVHVGAATTAALGEARVSGLAFKDGTTLECDLVVVAAGIRPNVELAVRAGLRVERGIVVGDDLACVGEPDVYAIGECAEHRGKMYGLVAPLWDQAAVLADRLSERNPNALFQESRVSTKLKVAGIDLAVMGDKEPTHEDDEVVSFADASRGVYKKLIVRNQRLIGAIVVGDGVVVPALLRAFLDTTEVPDDRAELMFRWPDAPALPRAIDIPDTAQICDCNAVSKAQIIRAVLDGARTVGAVSDATRACTGCGSCRVEVQRIVDLACDGMTTPVLLEAPAAVDDPAPKVPSDGTFVVAHHGVEDACAPRRF